MLKIAQQLKIRWPNQAIQHHLNDHKVSDSSLLNWYVKPAQLKDMGMLLFINESTLMPIVVPGIDFLRVDVRLVFQEVLLQQLALSMVNRQKARTYIDRCLAKEKFEPNLTTNFMIEKASQEYQKILMHQELDLVHDQEEGRLMQDLVNLGHQLTTSATCLPTKSSPAQLLAAHVNDTIMVAAALGKGASKLRKAYNHWADQRSLTPNDKGFKTACQQIRELNVQFLSGFDDWLSQSLDKQASADVDRIVSDFQNHYLLEHHPLTICDDLTAVATYLMANLPQNDQQAAVTYLRAFDLMGQYIMGIKLWTDADYKVYHDALIDGGQGLVENADSPSAKQAAYLKMVTDMLVELTDRQTDVLKRALTNLSPEQRAKIQGLLKQVSDHHKED